MKFCRYPARVFAVLVTLAAVVLLPELASAGDPAFRTLYGFQGGADGWLPLGVPAVDKEGNLYGVTNMGGGGANFGTVFKLTAPQGRNGTWTKSVLYDFPGGQGAQSPTSLVLGADGNLYGVVYAQTIFELKAPIHRDGAWKYRALYTLNGNSDGGSIVGNLIFDGGGNLYGAAELGGDPSCLQEGCGTVFELKRPIKEGGKWHFDVLHTFTGDPDGAEPFAGVTFDGSGNLYGTTYNGGSYDGGAVYRMSPPTRKGQGWSEAVIYSFDGTDNIIRPEGPVVFDTSGNLYGTTPTGGDSNCDGGSGCGVVFELAPPTKKDGIWSYATLYAFEGGNDGIDPQGCIVFDSLGNLYSTTEMGGGGRTYSGIVFRLSPPGGPNSTWTETVLHRFIAGQQAGPDDGLTWGKWGDLYGVTLSGGGSGCYGGDGCGAVFELRP